MGVAVLSGGGVTYKLGTLAYPIDLQLLLVDANCDALGPVAQHLLIVMVITLQL